MRSLRSLFIVMMLAIVPAACDYIPGQHTSGADDISGPPGSQPGTLIIANNSGNSITAVYFAACSNSSWGSNRMVQYETFYSGTQKHYSVSADCYDVMVVFMGGSQSRSYRTSVGYNSTATVTITT
jgi:hypothetical protein